MLLKNLRCIGFARSTNTPLSHHAPRSDNPPPLSRNLRGAGGGSLVARPGSIQRGSYRMRRLHGVDTPCRNASPPPRVQTDRRDLKANVKK